MTRRLHSGRTKGQLIDDECEEYPEPPGFSHVWFSLAFYGSVTALYLLRWCL